MIGATSRYLTDTNIVVYAYDPTDRVKQERASAILARLEARHAGALSTQILGEFFTTVTRKIPFPLSAAQAERSVTNYVRAWRVYDLTVPIVVEAIGGLQRRSLSYWDALIWATAKLNGVPNVLSEDFDHGALIEGVRFMNPLLPSFDPALL